MITAEGGRQVSGVRFQVSDLRFQILPLGWFLGIFWLGEFRVFEILVWRWGRVFLGRWP